MAQALSPSQGLKSAMTRVRFIEVAAIPDQSNSKTKGYLDMTSQPIPGG